MTCFDADDEVLHYADGSHRRIPPRDADVEEWGVLVDSHVEKHSRRPDADTYLPGKPAGNVFVDPRRVN